MSYVSDHAVMNVHGIDVAAEFGCATVKLGNGARLRLQGDVACTCFEARKHKGRRAR